MSEWNIEGDETMRWDVIASAPSEQKKAYEIQLRYFVKDEGWKWKTESIDSATYEQAARLASVHAHELDRIYGSDHFWTVELTNLEGEAFFQLFHGRLS